MPGFHGWDLCLRYISDFFCQHPRFVLHGPNFVQRSPVSIYMRHEVAKNLTYYIISGPESEECVTDFKELLNLACHNSSEHAIKRTLIQHPLEPHVLYLKILCESSQRYINQFRQSMFEQVHLSPAFSLFLSESFQVYSNTSLPSSFGRWTDSPPKKAPIERISRT